MKKVNHYFHKQASGFRASRHQDNLNLSFKALTEVGALIKARGQAVKER